MKKIALAVLMMLAFVGVSKAQTDPTDPTYSRTEITDPTAIQNRVGLVLGNWNISVIRPPQQPEHKGLAGWYNTQIFAASIQAANTPGQYTLTETAVKQGIGSPSGSYLKTFDTPYVYNLIDVFDVVQNSKPRTELVFIYTWTENQTKMQQTIDIFLVRQTGRIVGLNFAQDTVGSTNADVDGFVAALPGTVNDISAIEKSIEALSYQFSLAKTEAEQAEVFKQWSGYNQ